LGHALDPVLTRAERFLSAAPPLDRLFFEVLTRQQPAQALFAALALQQGADGALAPWRSDTPATELRATLNGLTFCDAIGLTDHPMSEAAVGYVATRQDSDGGFSDGAADVDARIALTGEASGLLARTPFASQRLLRAAESFLAQHWSVDLVQGPRYAPILAYTHLMAGFGSDLSDEVLQWCGRELERGFRTHVFAPVDVARVFLRARARALPGAQVEADEVVLDLLAAQDEDGGWPDAGGGRVEATLVAIEGLLRLS
jgi:hypothetical protein